MDQHPSEHNYLAKRVGYNERDQVCEELTRHYVDGRLNKDEFEQRMDYAFTAQTRNELYRLLSDLPRLAPPMAPNPLYGAASANQQKLPVTNKHSSLSDALIGFIGCSAFICLIGMLMLTIGINPPVGLAVFLTIIGTTVSILAAQHFGFRIRR